MDEVKKENSDNFSGIPNITHGEKSNMTEKARKNPWIVSSFILGAIILVFVIGNIFGFADLSFTGNVVSGNSAGNNLLAYLENNGYTAEISSVKESEGFYLVDFSMDGEKSSVYMTKDGKKVISGLIPISIDDSSPSTNTNTQVQDIPKTEKPSVELYVFTYCPYGLQMEKAMIPAVKLLGDKIDFKIRQIGAMHGEAEKIEAERQLCIEKNYPDKFLDYVSAFAEDTSCPNGAETCITNKLTALYAKLGFDAAKINSCMASEGEALYNAEVSNSNSKGVSGSPTILINGVEAQLSRSPDAVKSAACNAFTSAPSECSQTLDTNQASAGFGAGAGSASSNVQCAT